MKCVTENSVINSWTFWNGCQKFYFAMFSFWCVVVPASRVICGGNFQYFLPQCTTVNTLCKKGLSQKHCFIYFLYIIQWIMFHIMVQPSAWSWALRFRVAISVSVFVYAIVFTIKITHYCTSKNINYHRRKRKLLSP
jgi:hypothetical protein